MSETELMAAGSEWDGMPRDLAIVKMEGEQMMSAARLHPRSMISIKDSLTENLKAFPHLAEDAIYSKPVGKDPATGQQKYARGLSIRAAETLAEAYGWNAVSTSDEPAGDKLAKVSASFCDYQSGRIWRDTSTVSQYFKTSKGQMQLIPEDRFWGVVVKGAKSKATREVINRSVNSGLKAWFFAECEKIGNTLLTDDTISKICGQFSGIGVSQDQIETFLGRKRLQGWTSDDRRKLLETWTALKDNETTVAEVFGRDAREPVDKPKDETTEPGKVSGNDLANAAKRTEPEPKKEPVKTEPAKETVKPAAVKEPEPAKDPLPTPPANGETTGAPQVAMSDEDFDRSVTEQLTESKDGVAVQAVKNLMSEGATPAQLARLTSACFARVDYLRKPAAKGADGVPAGSLV